MTETTNHEETSKENIETAENENAIGQIIFTYGSPKRKAPRDEFGHIDWNKVKSFKIVRIEP